MKTYRTYLAMLASGESMDRLVFFSDAVFAIAMTLLIVELRVPEVDVADLGPALAELVPGYLTFMLSFLVVGIVWMSHHRKFRAIVRHDQNLVRLNLLLLLFVASIPLPTGILGAYGDSALSVYIYAATICLVGCLLSAIWIYAWHKKLIDPALPVGVFRYVLVQSFPIPGIFLLSIPLALVAGPTVAEISWILALPVSFVITRIYRTRSEQNPTERTAQ
ncbi:MAG: DUF1211 domain-containing protein [Microbacteriaceae bacterium]|nr:DUF1211 domain-containing protein [Microbacteriaceae bacterium]